jgi:hypothetical protein
VRFGAAFWILRRPFDAETINGLADVRRLLDRLPA